MGTAPASPPRAGRAWLRDGVPPFLAGGPRRREGALSSRKHRTWPAADLARESRAGVATVDRVPDGRRKGREETSKRVREAAHRIGRHAAGAIRRRTPADLRERRLGFRLQKERHAFAAGIEEAAASRFAGKGCAKAPSAPTT